MMKKLVVIMALGLALVLMGLTLSSSALTINTAPSGEFSLYQVFNNSNFVGGSLANNAALISTYTTVLETLPTQDASFYYSYQVTGYYASYAGFTQTPGWYLKGDTSTSGGFGFTADIPDGILVVPGAPINITATGEFGFYDQTNNAAAGTKYTELTLNPSYGAQSNGLIFQISGSQFIVAFEDGSNNQPLGDCDYNDLVLNITRTSRPIPLPPSALMFGTGLLGVVGLGWRRRKS